MDREQITLLNQAIDYVLDHFSRIGKNRNTYGFIHADLHPGNFVVSGDDIAIIDFDQLGRGYFCFDLAVMMVELFARFNEGEQFTSLWSRFKAGYAEVVDLPFADDRALAPFVIAVHLGFLDWIYNTPSQQVCQQWLPKVPQAYTAIRKQLKL